MRRALVIGLLFDCWSSVYLYQGLVQALLALSTSVEPVAVVVVADVVVVAGGGGGVAVDVELVLVS